MQALYYVHQDKGINGSEKEREKEKRRVIRTSEELLNLKKFLLVNCSPARITYTNLIHLDSLVKKSQIPIHIYNYYFLHCYICPASPITSF